MKIRRSRPDVELIPNVSFSPCVCVGCFNQAACPRVAILNVPRLIPVTQWLILDVNEY